MLIQWFPGHMAKTKRLIIEHLKAVDVAAELLDARIPLASANPMVEELLSGKPRIVILNKTDLADPEMTKAWESYYKRKGVAAVSMSCGNGKDKKKFLRLIKEAARSDAGKVETPRLENEIGTDHDSWNSQCRQVDSYQFYFRNSGGSDSQYAWTHTGQAVGPSFAGVGSFGYPRCFMAEV